MNKCIKWLERNEIAYRKTPEWSLVFDGNYPDGVIVNSKYKSVVRQYSKRNKMITFEYRGNYESIYIYPVQGGK